MDGDGGPPPKCAVCSGAGDDVRTGEGGGSIGCREHAPAALSGWILIAQRAASLAILGVGGWKLLSWLRR